MASNPTPVKLGPFNLGMNSRLPETELVVPKVGTFLRSAVNVDLKTRGVIKRRRGVALALAGTDCHSIWADSRGGYMVDGTELLRLTGPIGALQTEVVRAGLTPGQGVSFCTSPLGVVCTDGTRVDLLDEENYRPLSLPALDLQPAAAATTGSVPAGAYQLAFTYFDDAGRQGPSTVPVQVELSAPGGLAITNLPAAFPTGVLGVKVYMSEPNGDELFTADLILVASTTLTISSAPTLGARCPTLLHRPLPGGQIVRHHLGRFLVARGQVLYFTEPYATTYDPVKGFIPMPAEITMVESVQTGVFLGTRTDTYFLRGDVAAAELNPVLPYGVVAGTSGQYPEKNRCFWFSERGMCWGDQSGEVANVQEANVAVGQAQAGATVYREQDGMKQLITSLFGSETSGANAYSYMDAEIVRKASTL